jgi:hypothetical protein
MIEKMKVLFRIPPKFSWMKCLENRIYEFTDDTTVAGQISFFTFDRFGNPVFKCEWYFPIYVIEYIQYDTSRNEWFWETYLDLMIGYPRESPKDPLDVVDVSKFHNPEGSVARGLFLIFQMIKQDVKFFHPRDASLSKITRKYIFHLLICLRRQRENNILPHLPLEIILHFLTFLRFLDFGDQKKKIKYFY